VVTVKTLTQIGTSLGFNYCQKLGITTLDSGDNNQSLCLGGITNGVTNTELTAAYATIANGGKYNKPVFYTQVLDRNGDVLLDSTENESTEVMKETTAWLITSAMRDVMTSGTGTRANFSGMAVAGKSGTTTKDRDTVFCGFTPFYTCSIWGGFDDNTPQSNTTYSKNIWREVMKRIHEDLPNTDFTKPAGIVQVSVCKKSGLLPIEGVCDGDPRGPQTYTEYFEEGTQPTEFCDHHTMIDGQIFIVGASEGTDDTAYAVPGSILAPAEEIHADAATDPAAGVSIGDINVNIAP
jgi:penicillin-binding protein 1A